MTSHPRNRIDWAVLLAWTVGIGACVLCWIAFAWWLA